MLVACYGECATGHQFAWPARPDDYTAPLRDILESIRDAVADFRGHRDFIKSALVPPCDYFLLQRRQIVEFDESQHFSRPRLISLSLYPSDAHHGFSVARWMDLCRRIDAVDESPVDRDERRAWYDTLRDLVPALHGFRPTVRLYSEDYIWCSLDRANPEHRVTFKAFVESGASKKPPK
jgi:hypothetical protein